ncbi:MAG: CHAD domain-containing protein [Dermatophilaceae bacterium]|nr:CHAD domain-containing protein [Dermatophilaceae bacterium]
MTSAIRALQPPQGESLRLESMVHALSGRYVVVAGASRRVRRRRLDTFDRRLGCDGLALEHRNVATGERLVLSRADGSPTVTVTAEDLRWPALASALPPGPVRDAIAPVTGIRALMVVSDERRRIQSLALQNQDGKTVARVELDAPASPASAVPTEVTLYPLRGYDASARRAAALLTGAGLLPLARAAPPARPRPKLHGDDPSTVLLTTVLGGFLEAMGENLPGLLNDVDTEFLHDFRVAVRRTRSVLKLGRPALPQVMRSRWEPAFKWLGDLTTPVRDLDVYELDLPRLEGWLVSADAADLDAFATHLRIRRTAERRTLVRALRSTRYRRLVIEWGEELSLLASTPHHQTPGVEQQEPLSAGQLGSRCISRAHRRVARGGAAIGADSPAGDLHALRKRCKELRYALEVFAPVIDAAAGKRVIGDLKDLQDVLGRFQDSEVQRQALRGFAEEMMVDGTPAAAVLAMGELIGHLDLEQDRARREFDVAFARLERPSSLHLMHRLGGVT